MDPELQSVFAQIPMLAGLTPDDFTISTLPGYTNRNYRLHNPDYDWVLRLPRPTTNGLIDRAAEAHNQSLAHKLGLAPQVLWCNDYGITLTPTLRNSRNLRRADFNTREGIEHVVKVVQQLHRSGLRFQGRADLAYTLESHYDLLDAALRKDYAPRLAQAQRILSLLEGDCADWVPSHRDPVLGNLLLTDNRLWLIDWEYSAMAPPYWDLAILCNEAELDLAQSRFLLQAYCADGPAMQESKLFDYRGLLKLLSDCWMAALADL
ncbi:MAG: phosphotransferase family protein [Gammaproteobacteria bacterium]|nr:phosphotransferase family protein [Gammaproteobacteria bacterium]